MNLKIVNLKLKIVNFILNGKLYFNDCCIPLVVDLVAIWFLKVVSDEWLWKKRFGALTWRIVNQHLVKFPPDLLRIVRKVKAFVRRMDLARYQVVFVVGASNVEYISWFSVSSLYSIYWRMAKRIFDPRESLPGQHLCNCRQFVFVFIC